ncbi:MAG: hypothetical protein K2N90_03380, partial [Lachnospiraceae bacterium]|nr:hypothetical protein [Lachnospiraceae bacterium]
IKGCKTMPKTVGAKHCERNRLCVRISPTEEKSFYDKISILTSLIVCQNTRKVCWRYGIE